MKLDKYYESLHQKTKSIDDLVNAGAMLDKPFTVEEQVDLYTTPLHSILENPTKDQSVIYYTGGFAPFHQGHLEAILSARKAIENQTGEAVSAAFVAPDNDDYMDRKIPAHSADYCDLTRIQSVWTGTSDYSWIQVDVWPSAWCKIDYNFTTLYERFRKYCERWAPEKNIKVYFLYGSDNYLFGNAFLENGFGVCVEREGYPIDRERILSDRIVYGETTVENHSSTKIRNSIILKGREKDTGFYFLRNDFELSLEDGFPASKALRTIENALKEAIPEGVKLKTVNVSDQIQFDHSSEKTISLDAFYKTNHNIESTRMFYPNDEQKYSKRLIARPGFSSLEDQARAIPAGKYELVDDDIATGFTMNSISRILKKHGVEISDYSSLIPKQTDVYDVVDSRDFVIGAINGGLTVSNGNFTTRVPYLFPYVNLVARAKIAPEKTKEFSLKMWKLNYDLYSDKQTILGDLQEQDFILLGFPGEMKVSDFCRFHLDLLSF